MSIVERQVHGYRQGHQLLATSVHLPKDDQSVVNRLSDVAGPLRPREHFDAYLTAYPLPSGKNYVLARTWQDMTVPRAGCVRTLSLIVPIEDWARAEGLTTFMRLLDIDGLPAEDDATQVIARETKGGSLPAATGFRADELMESLFLEEARAIVVFDAVDPDLVATRLLTALWPGLRKRFAVSTFGRSPRKIGGRDFDLLFAPKDARGKFADWNGRRIDGRSVHGSRHRWTDEIVSRVFERDRPRLLNPFENALVGGNETGDAAALRIALLWDELVSKLRTTPTAALGLLDIANSGKVEGSVAIETIEPSLVEASRLAVATLHETDAWSFLGAIARKLQGRSIELGRAAVAKAVEDLAARSPEGAIELVSQVDRRGMLVELVPSVAAGIAESFTERARKALVEADSAVLAGLLSQGGQLIARVSEDHGLIKRLSQVLPSLDDATLDTISYNLLPHLIEDWQGPAAAPLIGRLRGDRLASELHHLGEANDFAGTMLSRLVLDKAVATSSGAAVRSILLALPETERRNDLISRTLSPSVGDARWLIEIAGDALRVTTATMMLIELLRNSDDTQFAAILGDGTVEERALEAAKAGAPDVILRAVAGDTLPLDRFVRLVPSALEKSEGTAKIKLARHALGRSLDHRFDGDEIAFLVGLMGILGDGLDAGWAARKGLAQGVDAQVASRNVIAFARSVPSARQRMIRSIDVLASCLVHREEFDLDERALKSFAALLVDAEQVAPRALLDAGGHLLRTLLRFRDRPVSLLIAATFPAVYRELAKEDDVPDFFRFIPFFDWDRCKAAEKELADAFMLSTWPPVHLALTACRTGETLRILKKVSKLPNGVEYLRRIVSEADSLPADCRREVRKAIKHLGVET